MKEEAKISLLAISGLGVAAALTKPDVESFQPAFKKFLDEAQKQERFNGSSWLEARTMGILDSVASEVMSRAASITFTDLGVARLATARLEGNQQVYFLGVFRNWYFIGSQ
eukprot:TRINITY_DN11153_c0_g1_i1.p1 TRINITY_DN11153_c0_g1~~TRINITY_DN11153_c0_g1_i1.p1  ORF type:complete len:125 (-),score=35.56 TRINITY_DN11153_c0_g1_i1:125-457(-)